MNRRNFSKQRIEYLLDLVEKNQLTADKCPSYFNYADYESALNGRPGENTAMPDYILYDEDVPEYELSDDQKASYCKRGEFKNQSYEYTTVISSATRSSATKKETIREVDEKGDGNYKRISEADYQAKKKSGKYDEE